MVNAFLTYTIAIPFLITLLMRASSNSCVYNRTAMVRNHKYILQPRTDSVKTSLDTNFSTCCKTRRNTRATFLDVCNNFTKVDYTRNNIEEGCYNSSMNSTFCCQFKNLHYLGCLLYHYERNLRSNTSTILELKNKLKRLVRESNPNLCIDSLPKRAKRSKRSKRGNQDNENCRRICKLNETVHIYAIRWQDFAASNDCT